MSGEPRLRSERDGPVLHLVLDHPERRNALAPPLRDALAAALEAAEGDREVRALVLSGAGGTFCAGGDVSSMDVRDPLAGRERLRLAHRVVRLLALGAKPSVAAVEGWCVGAGLSLAMACDAVVAAEDARFAAGFGQVGLMGDLGLLHTLPARVGTGRARQILLLGRRFDGAEAERIGLADAVAPPGGALEAALALARTLAEAAPAATALTKSVLAGGLEASLEAERGLQSLLFLSEDHREGRDAFLARRPPRFAGR